MAPSWQEAVNTTAAVLASITALAALVTVVDSFWLTVYQVLPGTAISYRKLQSFWLAVYQVLPATAAWCPKCSGAAPPVRRILIQNETHKQEQWFCCDRAAHPLCASQNANLSRFTCATAGQP